MSNKPNACNVSSVSKLFEPLTLNKPVCSTIASTSNISNVSNVSQHLRPLNVNKSMSSYNISNLNVHIVNSVSHHVKPLSAGKSICSRKVSKPAICESVVVNLSKRARKQSFNVSSHKHGVTKSHNVRSILMTSIYFYKLVLLFFIFYHNLYNNNVDKFFKGYVTRLNHDSLIYHDINIFNISHTSVLSSSNHFHPFSLYFFKYSFLHTVFLMIYFK